MVTVTGNWWRRTWGTQPVPFNAVLDVQFSDVTPGSGGGGAQILNDTAQGATFQHDDLIGATIYLLFLDGVQFTQVDEDDIDPSQKQFWFDSTTGIVTFSYPIDDPVAITIFYTSPATGGLPGAEPVTVAEFKNYAKIDTGSLEDTIIEELITTAREQCEDYLGVSIVARTVTALLNNSCGGIFLPYCPRISIISVKDSEGEDIATDDYTISGMYFPQLREPWDERITVSYTAGYGIPPKRIKSAILQQTFFLYENRGDRAIIDRFGGQDRISLSPQAMATLKRLRRVG